METMSTSFITSEQFPLVIQPKDKQASLQECLKEIRKHQSYFKENLLSYGGILFRNFPFQNVDDFAAFLEVIGMGKCVDYVGGDSPRNKIKGNIYTSTEAPPSFKIPLHNELSFVKNYPSHIFFFCETASETGGETMIADCRKIFKSIDPEVKKRFMDKGLKYVSRYYSQSKMMDFINKIQRGHKTWMEVLETASKQEVEQKCRQNEFEFCWNKNDWLEISQTRPATIHHPETQENVWFNQAHLYDYNPKLLGWQKYLGAKLVYCRKHTRHHEIFFADGKNVPRKDLYHVLDVLDANTVSFPWQKGDILALDNVLSMHGRMPFTGKRRILTAMTR